MSIVIRPSPDVFRRKMPLLAVFGAYRDGDGAGVGAGREDAALADLVAEARRYRVPVAFCRPAADGAGRGSWLPGCRPTVRDMMFDIAGRSSFASADFERALRLRASSGLCLCGPSDDPLFRGSVADALAREVRITVLDLSGVLRECSTRWGETAETLALAAAARLGYLVSREAWLGSLRNRSAVEGYAA